jgi:antitoxin component of RelBE/YafQ-DinJ toxin-antitoxin module
MLKLTKEVKEKLRFISEKLDMPMAQVVNMLVNQWIKDNT